MVEWITIENLVDAIFLLKYNNIYRYFHIGKASFLPSLCNSDWLFRLYRYTWWTGIGHVWPWTEHCGEYSNRQTVVPPLYKSAFSAFSVSLLFGDKIYKTKYKYRHSDDKIDLFRSNKSRKNYQQVFWRNRRTNGIPNLRNGIIYHRYITNKKEGGNDRIFTSLRLSFCKSDHPVYVI